MPRKSNTRAAQGNGTIRKKTVIRNGQTYTYWEARITTGRDPGTGWQIQKSFSGSTQKEVREKMQAAAVAINDGDYLQPSKMAFGQWLDIWLAEYQGDKPPPDRHFRRYPIANRTREYKNELDYIFISVCRGKFCRRYLPPLQRKRQKPFQIPREIKLVEDHIYSEYHGKYGNEMVHHQQSEFAMPGADQ